MHVPPPVDAGNQFPCACVVQPSASGRQQHGRSSKSSRCLVSVLLMRRSGSRVRTEQEYSARTANPLWKNSTR